MIIPSVDLRNGNAVQLVGGKEMKIDAGDPRPIARQFAIAGEIAVIDLDAALSTGTNEATIRDLLAIAECRVGGGIRTVERAIEWLDAGACRVILGTAARPEILRELPRERVIAALDAEHDDVVVEGWTKKTGATIVDRMRVLREHVGGFLVTFVEREGRMGGIDMDRAALLKQEAGDCMLTVAGGVRSADEIAALDALGIDAQVGMAIYSGAMDLGDAILAPARTDRTDGLYATVVVDERGIALGMCWSSAESIREAVRTGTGVYWSRSRNALWRKGESSGAVQELLRIDLDCDRDALRFTVRQRDPGFCHNNTRTCWGEDRGVSRLSRTLTARLHDAPPGSYTRRLIDDPELLRAKLAEEAQELADATNASEAAHEAADLIYFALTRAIAGGASLEDIERVLDGRTRRVTRRPGHAKPAFTNRTEEATDG